MWLCIFSVFPWLHWFIISIFTIPSIYLQTIFGLISVTLALNDGCLQGKIDRCAPDFWPLPWTLSVLCARIHIWAGYFRVYGSSRIARTNRQTEIQTDRWMDGCYQVHHLPASQLIKRWKHIVFLVSSVWKLQRLTFSLGNQVWRTDFRVIGTDFHFISRENDLKIFVLNLKSVSRTWFPCEKVSLRSFHNYQLTVNKTNVIALSWKINISIILAGYQL